MTEWIIGACVVVVGVGLTAAYREYRALRKHIIYRAAEIAGQRRLEGEVFKGRVK